MMGTAHHLFIKHQEKGAERTNPDANVYGAGVAAAGGIWWK